MMMRITLVLALVLGGAAGLVACGGDGGGGGKDADGGSDPGTKDVKGVCLDTSGTQQCTEYVGVNWNEARAADNCDDEGDTLTWGSGSRCPTEGATGTCALSIMGYDILQYYYDPKANSQLGCQTAGGVWTSF